MTDYAKAKLAEIEKLRKAGRKKYTKKSVTRTTSAAAYKTIRDNGLLSRRRWQVYKILYKFGPLTGNEIAVIFKKNFMPATRVQNQLSMTTRLAELRELGAVREIGKRICSVSGMTVILWDVTDCLPSKKDRKKESLNKVRTARDRYMKLLKQHRENFMRFE